MKTPVRRPALRPTLIAFAVLALEGGLGAVPRWCLLGLAAAPLFAPVVAALRRETEGPALVRALKATARLHALFGGLIAIGAAL